MSETRNVACSEVNKQKQSIHFDDAYNEMSR